MKFRSNSFLLGVLLIVVFGLLFKNIGTLFTSKKTLYSPLILQTGRDSLLFVGEPSPVDGRRRIPKGVKKVIGRTDFFELVKKGDGKIVFSQLPSLGVVGIVDEGEFSSAALAVLVARKEGFRNVAWVNGNNFDNRIFVSDDNLEKVKIPELTSGNILNVISFDDYILVLRPYQNMLGSGDVLVYLGAGIDKKADVFSGLIANWTGQVCDIYLGSIADKEGFDLQEFDKKFKDCFSRPIDKIYFWYPKHWRRSAVPILFLKNSQYSKNQK